jgi:hypothetical protein
MCQIWLSLAAEFCLPDPPLQACVCSKCLPVDITVALKIEIMHSEG